MKLELTRSGGIAGRVLRWSVTVEQLPAATRDELTGLLGEAAAWQTGPSRGADRFTWRIRTSGDGDLDVSFGDPPPNPASRLVELVRKHSPG